jgi:chromosome partitioning protein
MSRSQFHQRTVYRQSAVFGQAVYDFCAKATSALEEVEMLVNEVLELLGNKKD